MKSKRINKMLATTMTMAMLAMPAVTATSYAMESTGLETEYTYNNESKQQEEWIKSFDTETGKEILLNKITNEKVSEVYETIAGKLIKLNINEALEKFNLNEETITKSPKSIFGVSSVKKITGSARKISQDVSGGKSGATISIGNSTTVSESFSVGGTTEAIKAVVRANSGFTWSRSLTRSVTTTHKVPAGKIGYVAFKPYFKEVRGTVNGVVAGTPITQKIVAQSPIKAGNVCDGLEYLAYK
ncbi:TPA: hypothetical protein SHV50_003578 [Clostridioides difficile]|nr:hypothetical protein [Clostridioides difficile]